MNQKKIILLLAVCGLSVVAAENCGEEGFHVVEGDCSRYYRCVNDVRYDFECGDGYKFHAALEICVDAYELDCEALWGSSTEPSSTTTADDSATTTAGCPNGDGYFVDEQDCNRFYVCSDGVQYFSNCENGLYFDTVSKLCSDPATAKCTN